MRSESTATCTSGDPVSPSFLANSDMTSFLRSTVIDMCRSSSSKVEDTERSKLALFEFGQCDRLSLWCRTEDRKPLQIVPRNAFRKPGEQVRSDKDGVAAFQANRIRTRDSQRRDAVQRGCNGPQVLKSGGTMP